MPVQVDPKDADLLTQKRKPAMSGPGASYVYIGRNLLHRLVMERMLGRPMKRGETVDHENHKTDNRRANLKLRSHSENLMNRLGAMTRSASGIRGVSYDKSRDKWYGVVQFEGRTILRHRFDTQREAAIAVLASHQTIEAVLGIKVVNENDLLREVGEGQNGVA